MKTITIAYLFHTIQIQKDKEFCSLKTKVIPEAVVESLNRVQKTYICRRIFGEIGDLYIHKYMTVNLSPLKQLKISSVSF